MKDRSHDDAMIDYFFANPAYAEALLAEFVAAAISPVAILLRQLQEVER